MEFRPVLSTSRTIVSAVCSPCVMLFHYFLSKDGPCQGLLGSNGQPRVGKKTWVSQDEPSSSWQAWRWSESLFCPEGLQSPWWRGKHRFTHPYSEVHLTGSPCLSPSQGSKHQGPFYRGVDTAATMLSKARPLPWLHLEFRGGGSSRCPRRKRSGGTHRRTLALGPLSLACISKRWA